jgi:hypothetical protein
MISRVGVLPPQRASEHDPSMHTAIRSLPGLLLLLPAAMLAACGSDEGEPDAMPSDAPPAQEFVLGFGETIRAAGLSLEFTTLAEDSRCPTSVVCVWEGNARVLITATRGGVTSVLELNSNPRFPVRAEFEGHAIELRRVDPYPVATAPPRVQDYTVTLFVDFGRLE